MSTQREDSIMTMRSGLFESGRRSARKFHANHDLQRLEDARWTAELKAQRLDRDFCRGELAGIEELIAERSDAHR